MNAGTKVLEKYLYFVKIKVFFYKEKALQIIVFNVATLLVRNWMN